MRKILALAASALLLVSAGSSFASNGTTTTGGATTGTSTGTATGTGTSTGAADGASTGTNGTPNCDWSDIKASIAGTESGSQGCTIQASGNGGKWGAANGKYQFIAASWATYSKGCPNAANCPHSAMKTQACCPTQECAMDNLLAANKAYIEKSSQCQAIMGKSINSKRYGSCTVTMSGLLAAAHLAGAGGACSGIGSGGYGRCDKNGTCTSDYICKHGGKSVPGQCTPTMSTDPNVEPPVATLQQIESREAFGDEIMVGPPNPLRDWWVYGLMLMAEQFTTNMAAQVEAIGTLLDAKHQLETQELLQRKAAEAHKDYQPSEQMCVFGTFVKDLAATDRTMATTKSAVANQLLQREIGNGDSMGITTAADSISRIAQFRKRFCNELDNGKGLQTVCDKSVPDELKDADINYTQALDKRLSLAIDLKDGNTTTDEETVFALIDNLFSHDPPPRPDPKSMETDKFKYQYMNLRSIIAMRGIARNSIASIIALKTQTPNGENSNAPYLKALIREFGLTDPEITKYLGENPSYYAQMELLTKKMYQDPSFYAVLYDKPANVERMRAAMTAIKLMQDRDIQAALQRREMLMSLMLELRLREQADNVYDATQAALFED